MFVTWYRGSQCTPEFALNANLRRHTKAVHEKIKYNCKVCGKNLSGHEHLKRHIEGVHDKIKPYKCNICCKQFGSRAGLASFLSIVTKNQNIYISATIVNVIIVEFSEMRNAVKSAFLHGMWWLTPNPIFWKKFLFTFPYLGMKLQKFKSQEKQSKTDIFWLEIMVWLIKCHSEVFLKPERPQIG